MNVFNSGDGSQEVSEIVALGKPGELGVVVEPDVNEAIDAGALELGEEGFRGLFGEADGEEMNHGVATGFRSCRTWLRRRQDGDPVTPEAITPPPPPPPPPPSSLPCRPDRAIAPVSLSAPP